MGLFRQDHSLPQHTKLPIMGKKIEADGSIIWIIKNLNPPYYIEIKDSDIGVSPPDENNDLSVTLTLNYPLFFSQILSIDDTTISARTTMRMEPAL